MAALRHGSFLDRIAEGKPIPAVVLLGADPYLRNLTRSKLVERFVPLEARSLAVARYSAKEENWHSVFEHAQMMPMLSPCQVLILQDLEALEQLGEESSEKVAGQLAAYLADPAPFTILVMEAASLDRRRRLYKILSEQALLVELSVGNEGAVALAAEMAEELGTQMDSDAASLLIDILDGEVARVRLELEKLAMYAAGRPITTRDVEALVVSAKKYTVWQLAEMLAERNREAALEFLNSLLREGAQPAAIVGGLAWMYRKLVEARELPPHSTGFQAARELGMRPETAELAIRQSQRIPRADLLAGIQALAEADNLLKSGAPDPRAVMEFLVAQLAGTGPVPAA